MLSQYRPQHQRWRRTSGLRVLTTMRNEGVHILSFTKDVLAVSGDTAHTVHGLLPSAPDKTIFLHSIAFFMP
jgi:hypothetical protein